MSCGWKFLIILLVRGLTESEGLLVHVIAVGVVGTEAALLRETLGWRHTKGLDLGIRETVLIVKLIIDRRVILLGEIYVKASESTFVLLLLIHSAPLVSSESIRTDWSLLLRMNRATKTKSLIW